MRDLQILYKMMKKSNHFLASKQTPVVQKNLDDVLNNAGVKKPFRKLAVAVHIDLLEFIRFVV